MNKNKRDKAMVESETVDAVEALYGIVSSCGRRLDDANRKIAEMEDQARELKAKVEEWEGYYYEVAEERTRLGNDLWKAKRELELLKPYRSCPL